MLSTRFPRRAFLSLTLSTAAAVVTTTALPHPCLAVLAPAEARAEALAARSATDQLRVQLQLADYAAFRRALRAGPMSRVRASCFALAGGARDRDEAQRRYKRLVAAVERVDGQVLKKERGGGAKEADGDVDRLWTEVEKAFDAFLEVVGGFAQ